MSEQTLTRPVDGGLVRGVRLGEIETWRGIPFAAPVSGALRLRGPQSVRPWEGVRQAASFGASPIQHVGMGAVSGHMSEDALTVNVTRRAEGSPGPKPVLVFLYGGANAGGTSAYPLFGGLPFLATEDVVYVTGNYRVGPFGFIDFSSYATSQTPIDSNLGLRDQLAILTWVQRNIAAFGGDPGNVTLAGQSAGALGVTTLMAVPQAAGLFHAAISQSSPAASVTGPERARRRAERIVNELGATSSAAAHALATVPPEQLLDAADRAVASERTRTPGILSYSSTVDGDLLPEHPLDVLADGRAHPVPLLIGTTDNEGTLFARASTAPPAEAVEGMLRATDPSARDRILAAYPAYPKRSAATAISGDFLFWAPTVHAAEGHAKTAPVWMYRYDYTTPLLRAMRLGATHGMDLMAAFGPENSELGRKAHLLGGRRGLAAVSTLTQRTWLDLVTRRDEPWPRYEKQHRHTLIVTGTPHEEEDPRAQRRQAWEGFAFYR